MRRRVTSKTLLVNLLRSGFVKPENLMYVTAALHVRKTRSMAVLAGQIIVAVQEDHLGVRIIFEGMRNIGMAGFAHLRADIPRWKRCSALGLGCFDLGDRGPGCSICGGMLKDHENEDEQKCGQQGNSSHWQPPSVFSLQRPPQPNVTGGYPFPNWHMLEVKLFHTM